MRDLESTIEYIIALSEELTQSPDVDREQRELLCDQASCSIRLEIAQFWETFSTCTAANPAVTKNLERQNKL